MGGIDGCILLGNELLVEEFQEQVPSTLTFNVGYFEGQSHSKISLVCYDDLDAMYARYNKKGDIILLCDSRVESSDEGRPLGKRRKEEAISKRQEKLRRCMRNSWKHTMVISVPPSCACWPG